MSLPAGWESDYENGRWVYRYKTTGLTQYHFPRPGDEFPELVGLGFGPLDVPSNHELTGGHQVDVQSTPNGFNHVESEARQHGGGGSQIAANKGGGSMSATGYFDPDIVPYFGDDDISPVGGNATPGLTPQTSKSEPVIAELPEESKHVQSPVGFVAELASGETAKCAEELAPIELDATQIAPAALQINIHQNGPAELPTHRSPVEQKQPPQQPAQENTQPVDDYPLCSASFAAYPPLKTATRPVDNTVHQTNSSTQEQKVLASQRPTETQPEQNKYETWKPADGVVSEEMRNPNRQSMALSGISVLESQNSDLGPMDQKRHSLSGPLQSSGGTADLPGILRPPSGPKMSTSAPATPPQVESSPIPAALQPAAAPLKLSSSQDNSQQQPNGHPRLPGSGARHESISSGSGVSALNLNPSQVPPALKPAQSLPTPGAQGPQQMQANDVRPGAHRVNTLPAHVLSHTPSSSPPKLGGPGIYVFQEIPAATSSAAQQHQNKPHGSVNPNSGNPNQPTEQYHPIMSQPLPVIAPLSVSRPQKPASPDKPSTNSSISDGPRPPNSQSPAPNTLAGTQTTATPRPSVQNNQHNGIGLIQGSSAQPTSTALPSQGMNIQQPPQTNHSASPQSSTSSSPTLQQKLPRKPLLPQRPNSTTGISPGQQIQAQNHRPQSISGSSQHPSPIPQNSTMYATSPNTHSQSQPSVTNGSSYSLAMSIQVSNGANSPASGQAQPVSTQAAVPNPQNAVQRPQANQNQRPPSTQPGAYAVSQQPMIAGNIAGQHKPQSPPPAAQSVSPLQSQVSSPTSSIISMHRPPSSASSHTVFSAQGVAAQNRPPSTIQQNPSHVIKPTGLQGNAQVNQPAGPPVNNASKPFPMLPGQVKPMASQVGSTPMPMQAQQVHPAPAHAQYPQGQMTPMKPQQQPQQQMNLHMAQVGAQRPPQQQHIQGHQISPSGPAIHGQPIPAVTQHGQPRPPVHTMPVQQHIPVNLATQVQNQASHIHQGTGQAGQSPNGQSIMNSTQGTSFQLQASLTTQSSHTATSQTQGAYASINGQHMGQGQQQQLAQIPGSQSSLPPNFGGKHFDSAQAAAAITDAGKKMKKWAKKTWSNPAVKQTTVAVGGAFMGESLGGNAAVGASLANKIYASTQGQQQNGQQQRPPGPQHAHTAPPQAQNLQSPNAVHPNVQAMNRPPLQQGMQPMGVQTPGRPPVVQNPGTVGQTMNQNALQQQQQQQQAIMNQQQQQYQIARPPVGRPPIPQQQQPVAFGQPVYQAPVGQPMFQAPQGQQPLYQMHPNQVGYQAPLGQHPYQAAGGVDPYTAIGATMGGALAAFASSKPDSSAPASSQHHTTESQPQGHHAEQSEQHHETHSEPQHGGNSEQGHAEQSGQYHGQSEHYYDPYSEQNKTGYSEQHQQSHSEQHNNGYSEENRDTHSEQPSDTQFMVDNSNNEINYAPQDTTVINQTIINNVDNSATQISNNDMSYTDNTQNIDNSATQNNNNDMSYNDNSATQINNNDMSYNDNSQMQNVDMTNMNMVYADSTTYMDNSTNEANAYAESNYVDQSNMDMSMDMNNEVNAFADASYVDSSYAETAYVDASYVDTTQVGMDMGSAEYMGDQTGMMGMEESVSVDVGTVDYSGGDWGEW
ncbi:uncharacterized protein F4822DRAFT_185334 [Hypoxylon trugodes]|uniref:uncharacterized protein n=1 Tax=Hypoxylon trugodes TaxID=326681 RepID=UPI00219FC8C6|nr:uncharacterized protein F4822DRAFT_185334 [Hypoxylon trugodes]KAI1391416.1 hypothetical protein F4822DRAFT_185334 [Hypoxylon trugodes]